MSVVFSHEPEVIAMVSSICKDQSGCRTDLFSDYRQKFSTLHCFSGPSRIFVSSSLPVTTVFSAIIQLASLF